jgi:hypothetical protein
MADLMNAASVAFPRALQLTAMEQIAAFPRLLRLEP